MRLTILSSFLLLAAGCASSAPSRTPSSARQVTVTIDGQAYTCRGAGSDDGVSCACQRDRNNNCFRVRLKSGSQDEWINQYCHGSTFAACLEHLRSGDDSVASCRYRGEDLTCACVRDMANNCFRVQLKNATEESWADQYCNGSTLNDCVSYLRTNEKVKKICQ